MSRIGHNTDENINEIIEANIPKNTVYSKKFMWKAFMDFCNAIKYQLDGNQTVEELASILKDWAVYMRIKDGTEFKEAMVKTMWNLTMRCQSPINEEVILKHIKEETLVVLEPTEQRQENIFGNIVQDNSSIENNINITYHFDCNSQFMWQKFEVPWDQLPRQMIEACERGEREKYVINFIVHTVVNKMREIKSVIPSSAIKLVTKKIVDKFPETFRDLDEDGVVIGDGTHSVFRKIQDRNNYLNRPHKRTPKNNTARSRNKKKEMSQRAGCTNWDPPVDDSAGSYMRQIKENDENLMEKLEKCFPEQRRFLNTEPSFEAIKRECPILLTEAGASFHFNKLTSSDMATLGPAVEEKFEKFLKLNGFEEVRHKDSKLLSVLEIVTRYFKEDLTLIYTESDNLPTPRALESHPQIIKTGTYGNTNITYHLFYERCMVNKSGFPTFEQAFRLAFAIYFNFNRKYPANISLTMEFMQRYFFKIHPDAGSKANKPSFSRVVNLMNKMRRFQFGTD